MPLKCLSGGAEVHAFDFGSDAEWEALRAENARTGGLRMACCPSSAVLRTSKLGTRHFAHARRGDCATAPEGAEHLLAKAAIAIGVRRAGWTARVEQEGRTPTGEAWVADVLAAREGKRPAAFEVQWSPQSDAETRARQARYEAAGVRGMWFFRQRDFPWCEKGIPAFGLAFDESDANLKVLLPPPPDDPPGTGRKGSGGAAQRRQVVELSDFVEGALTGRLRFAPAPGRRMPLEVAAAAKDCWACGCETKIVTRLTFAAGKVLPGCSDIHASVYDFGDEVADGAGVLASMLPNDLLKRHGIGAIKRRYSRTEGGAYLSNGCLHCDALQGRFYDHDVWYDAETVLGVEVFFDPAWAGQLTEARDAIER